MMEERPQPRKPRAREAIPAAAGAGDGLPGEGAGTQIRNATNAASCRMSRVSFFPAMFGKVKLAPTSR
jgi:hypothetical protein